jgi:E3 ubiquitin-protein ligase TRIP12
MCRGLGTQHAEAAVGAAPILIGLLQYPDARLVDSACLALARVAAAFARSPPHLEQLCGLGLVASIVQMVGVSEAGSMSSQLQVSTFYGLLKILATMAAGSHVVAEALLQVGAPAAQHAGRPFAPGREARWGQSHCCHSSRALLESWKRSGCVGP